MLFALSRETDIPHPHVQHSHGLAQEVRERMHKYKSALLQIRKGEGRFSRDPHQHACNTIEDMKALANEALGITPEMQE